MGLFSKKSSAEGLIGKPRVSKEGGIMDMIRCDEKDFLIWKWRPGSDHVVGASRKDD